MWCPGCRSSSPLVAVQPYGLVCARCESEIQTTKPLGAVEGSSARVAEKASLVPAPASIRHTDRRAKQLETASSRAVANHSGGRQPLAALLRDARRLDSEDDESNRSGIDRIVTRLPADQPLYRFDPPHPGLGKQEATLAETSTREPSPSSVTDAAHSNRAPNESSESSQRHTSSTLRQLAAEPNSSQAVQGSLLPPLSLLRVLSRLSTLSMLLFLAGQLSVVWAFRSGEPLVLASGVLASAVGLALILFVVSRVTDDRPLSDVVRETRAQYQARRQSRRSRSQWGQ